MKKLFRFLVLMVLIVSLAACGSGLASSSFSTASSMPEPLNPATLTGLARGDGYPDGRRLTAVMINNNTNGRPQRGLTAAEMVVEIKVEGGITRLMALFSDYDNIPMIGPFRSARDQFFQLILPWQALYAHVGESTVMWQYFQDYNYHDFNLDGNYFSELWWQDYSDPNVSHGVEYVAFTDGAHIADSIETRNLDDDRTYASTVFNFVPYDTVPRTLTDGEMHSIAITHSMSYRTYFDFNTSTGRYDMSMYNSGRGVNEKTIDKNNDEQVAFDNVVVLFAPMNLYPGHEAAGVMQVHYEYGGYGYYFNNGRVEIIRWMKGPPMQPLLLVNADGTEIPVEINPGKTYLAIVDDKEQEAFVNQVNGVIHPPADSSDVSGSGQ